jgi:hypothetical protein
MMEGKKSMRGNFKKYILIYFFSIFIIDTTNAQIEDMLFQKSNNLIYKDELLNFLDWDSLLLACKESSECTAFVIYDSLVNYYRFHEKGFANRFDFLSFEDRIIKFDIDIQKSHKQNRISYFDKQLWLDYAHKFLGEIPDSLKITAEQEKSILISYYTLLGVGVVNEYGWICEYSTVGSPPKQREAIFTLIQEGRLDLIKKLLYAPNIEAQVYAIDALIYKDFGAREFLKEFMKFKSEKIERLQSLNLKKSIYDGWIKSLDEEEKSIRNELLSDEIKLKIETLRSSNQMIRTCGNQGSYKIYNTPISKVLSDSAISEIPELYKNLRETLKYKNR